MDRDISIPPPIKVEDWTFIDLDFDIHEWTKTVDKKLADYHSCWSEDSLNEVMRWYIDSFRREATNILKMASICKKHMQQRMLFFYICESDINLQRSTFSKTYFDNMEDILAFYINVEIFSGVLRKQDNSRSYNRLLRKTARRIINMLNQYLCLRDTLQDHFIRKYHVLMKMEINDRSTETKDLLNMLYEKLLTVLPKNKSDLAFCRSYILYQKWKIFRDPSEWLKMNELLYKMYDRTPESIENNVILKQILLCKNNSILDVLTHISNNHLVMTKEYFKFIQGDECLGDCPVLNYHSQSPFVASESKPRSQRSKKQYLQLLSGLTISNTPSRNTKRELPNAKVSFSTEETSKAEQSNKAVRTNKVEIPNKLTKSNSAKVLTRSEGDDDDDDVQIINSEIVKYIVEIPYDDDLCEIVVVQKEANPALATNNKSFLDSIDISENKVKGTLQRKNVRSSMTPNNNRFRPKLKKANKTSPNTNLSGTCPAKEVIVDISEQDDSEKEVIDISEQNDSGKEMSTDTSKRTNSEKKVISDRDKQKNPKKEICNHKIAEVATIETQTDPDLTNNNNNNNVNGIQDKRDYVYKNHHGLVTPPSDQHSEEPDLGGRPLVYMERVVETGKSKVPTPLFLSENLERIQDETHKTSTKNCNENDIEERAPTDVTTSACNIIPAETVPNVIPTTDTLSNNDKLEVNIQPTENNKNKFHSNGYKNCESHDEPEVNPDVNVAEFSESTTCEGSQLIPSSATKTSNHLAKSLAEVCLSAASPVISRISTVSHEDNTKVLTSNENINNTDEIQPETCVSNDNHSCKENSGSVESESAKKTSQSDIEPIEAGHIETESHTGILESNTSEKSNEVYSERKRHSDTSDENIHIEVNKQITKELTVNLEKIPIPEEERSIESMSMSDQSDSCLLKDYINFDTSSTILNDCYKDQYMDSILSGPVEKPGASYEHINPDKTFDLFDNRICSTPIEQVAAMNTDIPIINMEITSPMYEGIDDFRKFYEDKKNSEKLNNIDTNAAGFNNIQTNTVSAVLPQSPDQAASGETPFGSSKSLHSLSENCVELRLSNNFQEHPDKYSASPQVANNNKRKRISFADPETEIDISRRPLLTSLKPNGFLQSVLKKPPVVTPPPKKPSVVTSPQIKKTTRPRIPRRLLNIKSLSSYNMQPNDLYLQSEPYVELIKLRDEEVAQALRINMGIQRAREHENNGDSSVIYRVDYDKQGSLDIGKNDIVQYKGKSIPLTVMQQRFRKYDGRTSPPVRQKERGRISPCANLVDESSSVSHNCTRDCCSGLISSLSSVNISKRKMPNIPNLTPNSYVPYEYNPFYLKPRKKKTKKTSQAATTSDIIPNYFLEPSNDISPNVNIDLSFVSSIVENFEKESSDFILDLNPINFEKVNNFDLSQTSNILYESESAVKCEEATRMSSIPPDLHNLNLRKFTPSPIINCLSPHSSSCIQENCPHATCIQGNCLENEKFQQYTIKDHVETDLCNISHINSDIKFEETIEPSGFPQDYSNELDAEDRLTIIEEIELPEMIKAEVAPQTIDKIEGFDSEGVETRLPLKKRKLSVVNSKEEITEDDDFLEPDLVEEIIRRARAEQVDNKEDISYPAKPMISIAEVQEKFAEPQPRLFKTPAEKKEMPPPPLHPYQTLQDPPKIIAEQYNNHTYNNPTINYHMNNVPYPFFPCASLSYFPPILLPINSTTTFDMNLAQQTQNQQQQLVQDLHAQIDKKPKKERKSRGRKKNF